VRPITDNVYSIFLLSQEIIAKIKQDLIDKNKSVVSLPVCYEDTDNNIYSEATKTIYIADREYVNSRKK
ncbi:hypothetical protein NAI52_11435, partial [Francisella tularensis subsp. holarctica]|nr:hypothetical protein [Francisella tularensis subsp. holarctica]